MRDHVRGRGEQRAVVQRVVPGQRRAAGHKARRPRQAQVRHHGNQQGERELLNLKRKLLLGNDLSGRQT